MKTTIYLDVDGVLNAVSGRTPSKRIVGWEEYREVWVAAITEHINEQAKAAA